LTAGAGDQARSAEARRLRAHLEATYGTGVTRLTPLDEGVFRVDRDDGPAWVARQFPVARPAAAVAGDAEILAFLAGHDYPAERAATADPVSQLDGHAVLVTGYVPDAARNRRVEAIRGFGGFWSLGVMLARLHTLPAAGGAVGRDGGAWHHLADGGASDEIAAVTRLLDDAGQRAGDGHRAADQSLRADIDRFGGCAGLPRALTHPDFVLANVIASPERGLVLVDWAGAGREARLWSLAWLLFSAGARGLNRVDSAVAGYLCHVRPEPEELARLAEVARIRPAVLEAWSYGTGRKSLAAAARAAADARDLADAVAARALLAFRDAAAAAAPRRAARPTRPSAGPGAAPLADFDVEALFAALDGQRQARGLTWAQVTREINGSFAGVAGARPVSASTLAGMLTRSSLEGTIVLLILRWLDRTPESFVPGHPAPVTARTRLPDLPPDRILRWDTRALYAAANAQRRERGMTWKQVADEIGGSSGRMLSGFTPGMLTGLASARHIGFPRVMRLVARLGAPAVSFTRAAPR
jgi:hypothetical protein